MQLNDIATEQTKATVKTQAATNQLLDYLTTHPDPHSDASYLSVSKARSRIGGFLGGARHSLSRTRLMDQS
jgi:hypothetical protein